MGQRTEQDTDRAAVLGRNDATGSTGDFAEEHAMLRALFDERDPEPDDPLLEIYEREMASLHAANEESFRRIVKTVYRTRCREARIRGPQVAQPRRCRCSRRARRAPSARRRATISRDDGDDGPAAPAAGHDARPELKAAVASC